LSAGPDAIAVTDHNTASWCDAVRAAAASTRLVVLPGVEISTAEGHLLGIREEGTSSSAIDDVLAVLGIKTPERGKLDVAATFGIAGAAREIAAAGGVAIAAHIDKARGVLETISVAAHQKRTLLEPCLSAVEVVHLDSRDAVSNKLGGERKPVMSGFAARLPGMLARAIVALRAGWRQAGRPLAWSW
jgi:predicted metal-dependent phosphoesterase TrpH